jgi:hypothetical protein
MLNHFGKLKKELKFQQIEVDFTYKITKIKELFIYTFPHFTIIIKFY